jgi:hypothetical protein
MNQIQQPPMNQINQTYPTQPPMTYPPPVNSNNFAPVINIQQAQATPAVVVANCCGHCGSTKLARVTRAPGATSWIAGFVICLVFWPLFWLPCVLPSCMDETYICPDCGRNR